MKPYINGGYMSEQRLTIEDVEGVFAIMATPATDDADQIDADFTVDLEESRRAARALVEDDVDAIMITGTFGEAATLTEEEWKRFTETVVDAVDGDIPVCAGPTTLNTRTTIERAEFARDVGADGMLLGRPMWLELSPRGTIQFYKDVAEAVPELGIIVYHNPPAFKNKLTPRIWRELAEIPQVVGAKYGTVDVAWRDAVEQIGDKVRLMPIERKWYMAYQLYPEKATAAWSGNASADPLPVVELRDALFSGDMERAADLNRRIAITLRKFYPLEGEDNIYPEALNARHDPIFSLFTIPLEKERFNAAGYMDAGPTRPPYHVAPEEYLEMTREGGREWKELCDQIREEKATVK